MLNFLGPPQRGSAGLGQYVFEVDFRIDQSFVRVLSVATRKRLTTDFQDGWSAKILLRNLLKISFQIDVSSLQRPMVIDLG